MNMTPYEFSVSLKLYKRKTEQEDLDMRYRYYFDRLMTVASLNPHIKHPIKDVTSFFEFYWEQNKSRDKMFDDIKEVDINAMFGLKQDKDDGGTENSGDIDN